ncbi:ATP-binding protein [Xanthomonas sp. AM6]|uniref:hybrid sensor histidine kinase/response regulator n=1 Tax=Xanthomonas sp. AM6 TaxID=2982531 RepID=UPI0021D9CD2F|nr:hybrid sensor histidine kinase/response regulator [Xanthomonas sp. AM6]UYB51990.1 ATP-binding protein [Xanthomonas sp. AM6]
MPARRRRPLPWLAASSAALAAAAALLAVPALAPPPPWQLLAPACIGAAALLAALAAWRARQQARALDAALARAALAESERDALQRDVHLRERLERELLQAKQAAEAAVMAKGEFLATMSHEIRTPLNGIIPMLELIARGQLGTEQREMLRAANDSSLQLLRIVDDILDYSKLEANRLELEITSFHLRELLDGVLQLMQRSAEAKGLRMALQLDPAVRLPVRGDPLRLRQVLSNLIGNAIKFTARGGVDLRVRRLGETPAQHLLRFEVRDTGIGISPEQQERLFRSFTQADASTTRLYGGTGLGLAICKRIVDLMGGRIGVESGSDQGATFWFEIPLLKVIGDLPQAQGSLPRLHALLVGADQRLYQRLKLLLPNWGMQLSKVDSTQEALERLRAGTAARLPYDLVIGDLDGLRQSARALQRAVTRLPAPHAVRLIWLYGEAEIPEEIRAHGALLSRQAADLDLRGMLALAPAPVATMQTSLESTSHLQHDADAAQAPVSPPTPDSHAPDPHAAATPASPAADYRLLLVEDNPVNLLVAQKLLDVLGYRSDNVADGTAALAQLATQAYDLVLMDCQMPVLDGYAATRQWRQSEAAAGRPRLPIVAMTANAMAGDRQRCLEAGMDDYLSKPVDRERLLQCLQRWLPHRAAQAMPAEAEAAPTGGGLPAAAQTPQAASMPMPAPTPTPLPSAETAAPAPDASVADPAPMPPLPPTPLPVLDIAVLDELRELAGSATTAQIVDLFLGDAPQLIQRMEQAAAIPQLEPLRAAAHTLKSSAANVGALALSAAASRIETGVRAHQLERPAVAVALVIAEFARARLALNGYRNTLRDTAAS